MDINDNEFRKMVEENYTGADIFGLWDSYILAKDYAKVYRRVGWHDDARESELEMEVLVKLMKKAPYGHKKECYYQNLEKANCIGLHIDNLLIFCETLESLEFFKKEILSKR